MTDDKKWRDPWFMDLPQKGKLLWLYLCDAVDCAGVWKENYKLASVEFGEPFTWEDIQSLLGARVTRISPTHLFIPTFVRFQQGSKFPQPNSKVHLNVVRRLEDYGIDPVSLRVLSTAPSPLIPNDNMHPQGGPTLIGIRKEIVIGIEREEADSIKADPAAARAILDQLTSKTVRGMP